MLAEAFVYLKSLPRTPAGFRRYLTEAVGLWARGMRQAAAWAPHIAQTRGAIDRTIDEIAPRRTVAVLGAGPLFDVPLEVLARTFARVRLIDRAHLATAERRLGRYANVGREWRDLSAAGEEGGNPLGFLAASPELDWTISTNLLSQLARAAPAGGERRVIDAHLEGLAALSGRASLITDVAYRVLDGRGRELERFDLLYGRRLPEPDLAWTWEVAPPGEEGADRRRVHEVGAWLDWGRTGPG